MAHVAVLPPLDQEFFGGRDALDLPAESLFALVGLLDAAGPGFAEAAEGRIAFALDGQIAPDWSVRLGPQSQVLVIQRIAGG